MSTIMMQDTCVLIKNRFATKIELFFYFQTLPSNSESVKAELNRWDRNYFDVEALQSKVSEVDALRDKVQLLEKRIQVRTVIAVRDSFMATGYK